MYLGWVGVLLCLCTFQHVLSFAMHAFACVRDGFPRVHMAGPVASRLRSWGFIWTSIDSQPGLPCAHEEIHHEHTQMHALQMTTRAEMYTNIVTLLPNLNTYQIKRSRTYKYPTYNSTFCARLWPKLKYFQLAKHPGNPHLSPDTGRSLILGKK
jgi:hypothetical protein